MPHRAKPNRTDLNVPKVNVPDRTTARRLPKRKSSTGKTGSTTPSPGPDFSALKFRHQTEQPNTPMTHELKTGPGAGSEAMGAFRNPNAAISMQLFALAKSPYGSPQIAALAQMLQQAGL